MNLSYFLYLYIIRIAARFCVGFVCSVIQITNLFEVVQFGFLGIVFVLLIHSCQEIKDATMSGHTEIESNKEMKKRKKSSDKKKKEK